MDMLLVGRILLGGYFIFSGINHFRNLAMLAGYSKSKKLPIPKALVILSGIALLVGGLTILTFNYIFLGCWLLIIFLFIASVTIHNFWSLPKEQQMNDMINFMKNIALIGALLCIMALA